MLDQELICMATEMMSALLNGKMQQRLEQGCFPVTLPMFSAKC